MIPASYCALLMKLYQGRQLIRKVGRLEVKFEIHLQFLYFYKKNKA